MRFFDLFRGHLFDHFFQTDRRIGVAADGAEGVPHVGADQIGGGDAATNLIVPADTRLRARMPLERRAQIPFKGAGVVARHTKAHGIHDANQLFSLGIAGPGGRPKRFFGLGELARLHQITRRFDVSERRSGQHHKCHKYLTHLVSLLCLVAAPAFAQSEQVLGPDDFVQFDATQAELGQLLFYDRILSGNKNIACSTCHHPDQGTSDGLSLGIGEGGEGVGPARTAGSGPDRIKKRIPRNAPGLWNLGAKDLSVMFHDGRLSVSDAYPSGFNSPAEEWLPTGFNSLLAAQAVFPLVAQFEMAGNPRENEIAGAVHDRIDAAWPILAKRVRITGDYGARFVEAFDHIEMPEDVTIVDIANALAAFMGTEWQSSDSPYDQFLAGDLQALDDQAQRGRDLFFGKGNCADCHAGPLFSDQSFYALGLPPFGPGRTRPFDPSARDVGRMGKSDALEDAYRFRTPMLRNVALTAPYGHNGAYPTLAGIIRHHVDPVGSFASWTPAMAALPAAAGLSATDFIIWNDRLEMVRQASVNDLKSIAITDSDIAALEAFLLSLTGATASKGRLGVPSSVPSGLPVDQSSR